MTAWIGAGVLGFLVVLYVLIVVIYCCRGKKYKGDDLELPPYQPRSSRVNTSSSSTKKGSEDKTSRAQDKTKRDSTLKD